MSLRLRFAVVLAVALTIIPVATPQSDTDVPPGAIARLGNTRFAFTNEIRDSAISPDGKIIAAGDIASPHGSRKGKLVLWNVATGQQLHELETPDGTWILKFSPDGKRLGVLGHRKFTVFETATGKVLARAGKEDDHWQQWRRFCATGRYYARLRVLDSPNYKLHIAIYSQKTNKLLHSWVELITSPKVNEMSGRSGCSYNSSEDGRFAIASLYWELHAPKPEQGQSELLMATRRTLVVVVDLRQKKVIHKFTGFRGRIERTKFTPDGTNLLVVEGGRLWRVDLANGHKRLLVKDFPFVYGWMTFLPDKQTIHAEHTRHVSLWDFHTGKKLAFCRIGAYQNTDCTAAGNILAVNYGNVVRLWDLHAGKLLPIHLGHRYKVQHVHHLPNHTLASQDSAGTLCFWDTKTWRPKKTARLTPPYIPNAPIVATDLERDRCIRRTKMGVLHLHRLSDNHHLHRLVEEPNDLKQRRYFLSPNGNLLALAGQQKGLSLHFYDTTTGKLINKLTTKTTIATRLLPLAFVSDDKHFTLPRLDGHLDIVEVRTGRRAKSLLPHTQSGKPMLPARGNAHCWSAAGRYFAGCHVNTVLNYNNQGKIRAVVGIWDTITGRLIRKFPIDATFKNTSTLITALAFTPDNRLLLAANSSDAAIDVWEVASGQLRGKLQGHRQPTHAFTFLPTPGQFASGSADTTILIWNLHRPLNPLPKNQDLDPHWQTLARRDAQHADASMWTFIRNPQQSLPLLEKQLHPMTPVSQKQIQLWIRQLDHRRFPLRSKATKNLANLGSLVEPLLQKALKKKTTLEMHMRLQNLLDKIQALELTPQRLRQMRALEVLERISSQRAIRLLQQLANGTRGGWLTEEARHCLHRLAYKG